MSEALNLSLKDDRTPARPGPDTARLSRRDRAEAEEDRRVRLRVLSDWGVVILVVLLVAIAWGISRTFSYQPGSPIGYDMGVAGGMMMLLILVYSLRKRLRFMFKAGDMKPWFVVHITLGILGPFLILLHSKFEIHSINAGVALICMALVALSGVIGRFIYMRIHLGLSGRHENLSALRAKHGMDNEQVKPLFGFAPSVLKRLTDFEEGMGRPANNFWHSWYRFATVGAAARLVRLRCYYDLAPASRVRAQRRGWDRDKLNRRRSAYRKAIRNYLNHVQELTQFDAYVKLFGLWHLLHIPLLYLLVASAIAHIVAVHMY